jgi:MFS family permease
MVAVMSVAPVRLTEHGHGLALVGLIVSVHVAGMFMPSPISGWLADRRGPVVVATIGFALLVTAGLAGALVNLHSGLGITLALVVLGIGWNFASSEGARS